MKRTRGIAAALMLAGSVLLAGCESRATMDEYRVSRDSLFFLHQAGAAPVSVGRFEGGGFSKPELGCLWLADVPGPNNLDYASYVREAFVRELRTAGLYSAETQPITLTGHVDRIEVNRVDPHDIEWLIQLTLRSSNGREVTARERFEFNAGGLIGPRSCKSATEALPEAVRRVLEKAITSRDFRALVTPGS